MNILFIEFNNTSVLVAIFAFLEFIVQEFRKLYRFVSKFGQSSLSKKVFKIIIYL